MSEPAGIEEPSQDEIDRELIAILDEEHVSWGNDDEGEKAKDEIKLGDILVPIETIYLDGNLRDQVPTARCTCGDSFGPSEKLLELGGWVMNHAKTHPGHIPRDNG